MCYTFYLKAAIEVKALNYIEKPFLFSDLYAALEKAVLAHQEALCRHEKDSAYQSAIFHLRSDFLNSLIDGTVSDTDIPGRLAALDNSLHADDFIQTAIVQFDIYSLEQAYGKSGIRHSYDQLSSILAGGPASVLFSVRSSSEILLLFHSAQTAGWTVREQALASCQKLQEVLNGTVPFLIGLGSIEKGLSQVTRSYETAQCALEYGFYCNRNIIVCGEDKRTTQQGQIFSAELRELDHILQSRNEDEGVCLLHTCTRKLHENPIFPTYLVRRAYYRVLFQAEQTLLSLGVKGGAVNIKQAEGTLCLDDLDAAAAQQLTVYWSALQAEQQYSATVRTILNYISLHYMESDLCIESISRHALVSASYVSSIFKAETGQTVNQYLTEYRIRAAKLLLQDTRYRIVDILPRIGFSNANYFSKVFRKYEGCTPREYREKYTK